MGRLLMYLVDTIILLVVSALVGRVLGDLFGGKQVGAGGTRVTPPGRSGAIIQGETARDPVCGTFVAVELSLKLREGAKTLHFCSDECLESYQKAHADG